MVEQSIQLDHLFQALADSTRRDILRRVAKAGLSISALAKSYNMTFSAIAKHVAVLERAKLITKERQGKEQIIIIVPSSIGIAQAHIDRYARLLGERYDKLEALLQNHEEGA